MAINPQAVGAVGEPATASWTSKDCLLYAVGVGAGTGELAYTTENTHEVRQQVLPTFPVITGFNARGGTRIDEWLGKSELYWGARKRTKAALRSGTHEEQTLEFADVLAWLATIANVVGVDLDEAVRRKYGTGCPGCGQFACTCPDAEKP